MPSRPAAWNIAAILLLGCAERAEPPSPPTGPLLVAAATDLREVLPALAAAFEAESGRAVTLTFGSSGQLAQQIENGAPFAVFLSANRKFVSDLADAGLVEPGSVVPYATGALALAINPGVAAPLPKLGELAADVRIRHVAIANPELAPYGAAARQALERSGAWAELEPKIVPVDTVDQAAQVVASGGVEAALVSVSGATARALPHARVDPSLHEPLVQYLGVTRVGSADSDAARFAAFVTSTDARAAFADRGFGPPPPSTP